MLFSLLKHYLDLYISDTALNVSLSLYCFTTSICHGVENYIPRLWGMGISDAIFDFCRTAIDSDGIPLGLHRLAFVPFVLSQSTEEQLKKWKPMMDSFKMIGSYCQTELGHGTYFFKCCVHICKCYNFKILGK